MNEFDLLLAGDVWDAQNGRQRDHWIAVRDGIVEGVYEDRPGSAETVESASVITPGLIDMHVHLVWDGSDDPVATLRTESEPELTVRAAENARRQLHGGVTTLRDLGSVADIAVTVARAVSDGRLRGPRIYASGRTIIITHGHDPFWGIESDGVDSCRQAVRTLRGAGADLIKVSASGGVYGQSVGESPGVSELSPEELSAIVDEAERFDLPVAAHAVGREGIANAVEAGVDTIEHGNLMSDETLAELIDTGLAFDPTLYVYQTIANGAGDIPEYARANAGGVVSRHREVVRSAVADGARIIAGSDAGSPGTPHPSLHRELTTLVETGMDEGEAMKAATLTAARELDHPELGVLEAGTPADLVAFREDPLADIDAVANPRHVVRDGLLVR